MIYPLLIALSLAAAPAKAAPAPAADESGDVKKAKDLFQWGQKLYKQARYAEAIAKFEEAYSVRPHPVIYFNIGKCYEQLGETAKALRAYRDYLRLAPDAKDKETVSDADRQPRAAPAREGPAAADGVRRSPRGAHRRRRKGPGLFAGLGRADRRQPHPHRHGRRLREGGALLRDADHPRHRDDHLAAADGEHPGGQRRPQGG